MAGIPPTMGAMTMRSLGRIVATVCAVACAGILIGPPALHQMRLIAAAEEPAALSALRLGEVVGQKGVGQERVAAEIDGALAAGDSELAESFVALAADHGVRVAPEQLARIAQAREPDLRRSLAAFGHGFWSGEREGGEAFAGALLGDVSGFGDLRDLAGEGRKWVDGREADTVTLGLAAAGLALSAATWASLGAAMPARTGLSVIKGASKAKALSPALTAGLGRIAAQSLDRPALAASLSAAGRLDLAAARAAAAGVVRPAGLRRLADLGRDAGTLYSRTGQRGVRQVLAVAEDAGDVGRAARLAAGKGTTLRATLKLLGRGALVLGALSLSAIGWLFALAGYAVALAMLAQRFGWWLGRRRWRLPGFARALAPAGRGLSRVA